jgi:hypothetical protein
MAEPLNHERLFELIGDLEAAVINLRNAVADGIYALEARVAILERRNRELRGTIGGAGENIQERRN